MASIKECAKGAIADDGILYPQPVMIIGTYDENEKANAMNAAWGGIVGMNEVIIVLGSHTVKTK